MNAILSCKKMLTTIEYMEELNINGFWTFASLHIAARLVSSVSLCSQPNNNKHNPTKRVNSRTLTAFSHFLFLLLLEDTKLPLFLSSSSSPLSLILWTFLSTIFQSQRVIWLGTVILPRFLFHSSLFLCVGVSWVW